jgi:hypothetical protein
MRAKSGPLAVRLRQIWSTSGASDRDDVSAMFLQPFANYNLGGGLSTGVSIEATANWEAEETWTAPLLFNLSKVALLGKRPVSFAMAAGPTLANPDDGANWRFRISATFFVPREQADPHSSRHSTTSVAMVPPLGHRTASLTLKSCHCGP